MEYTEPIPMPNNWKVKYVNNTASTTIAAVTGKRIWLHAVQPSGSSIGGSYSFNTQVTMTKNSSTIDVFRWYAPYVDWNSIPAAMIDMIADENTPVTITQGFDAGYSNVTTILFYEYV